MGLSLRLTAESGESSVTAHVVAIGDVKPHLFDAEINVFGHERADRRAFWYGDDPA